MPTVQDPQSPPAPHIVLRDVSWGLYQSLLREIGDQHVRLTYDRGDLEIMSPSPRHERWKSFLRRLIEILSLEVGLPIASYGSTTFTREDLDRGLEPDECYYVQHEKQVRCREDLDLRQDPPPDVVIEVDISRHALDREGIYAALGVPELWRFNGRRIEILTLRDGSYTPASSSLAFPFLRAADLDPFLAMFASADETTIVRTFQEWVRERNA